MSTLPHEALPSSHAALPADVKVAFVARRFNGSDAFDASGTPRLLRDEAPQPGDLALARVETIAQFTRLQLASGRRSQLYPGDRVLVCYGHRYALDQFEAEVPDDLGRCHLITAGGVAGRMLSRHPRLKRPTGLEPLGLLADSSGRPLNLRRYGLAAARLAGQAEKPVLAVLGTGMNAGKTTAAAALVRGLSLAGLRVAALKVTGTGSGNDLWALQDAGARLALDFADMGYPSTFRLPATEVEHLFDRLLTCADASPVDVTVVEVADGLLQPETAALASSERFKARVDGILFCAGDALGAQAGVGWLEQRGLPVTAVSGAVTASPLGVRETQAATALPVWNRDRLSDPAIRPALRCLP